MITKEALQDINKELDAIPVKGKQYVMVNERVKAFRKLLPNGSITTEIVSNQDGVAVMKATITDETGRVLATGLSYEKESNGYINKTSYIENCETSAVGRALGFLGIGIDGSMASADEVANAIINQTANEKIDAIKLKVLQNDIDSGLMNEEKMLKYFKVEKLEDVTEAKFRKYANDKERSGK